MSRTAIYLILMALAAALPEHRSLAHEQPPSSSDDQAFSVALRYREALDAGYHQPRWRIESWKPEETAVIVCDMWDSHHCYNAVQRVKDMAPRMNELLKAARRRGALIIHAPSSCMKPYADHPGRKRAQRAPQAPDVPAGIGEWCHRIPAEEDGVYPVDQSDGGEDDDKLTHELWHEQLRSLGRNPGSPWLRQIETLEIHEQDAITDQGVETWNLLHERGIQNVMLVGVHTNMCVLGRPFGLRQLSKNGKNVVLVRDLTDTMYNPASWPFVKHHSGTDLIVEHIEKYVCPTIDSSQILDDNSFRFYDDQRPDVAIVVSEPEYETVRTLPAFAHRHLSRDFHIHQTLNHDASKNSIDGLKMLDDAEVVILSIWRQTLPADQLLRIRQYIESGKSIVAIRTSSHAFASRNGKAPDGHVLWAEFDREVLGGHYRGHLGNRVNRGDPATLVTANPKAALHPVLTGVDREEFSVASWLYKMQPLGEDATGLLFGRLENRDQVEPVAWTRTTRHGGKVFYTSLGHPDDFANPQFQRLLSNAVYWAADLPVPELFPLTPERQSAE